MCVRVCMCMCICACFEIFFWYCCVLKVKRQTATTTITSSTNTSRMCVPVHQFGIQKVAVSAGAQCTPAIVQHFNWLGSNNQSGQWTGTQRAWYGLFGPFFPLVTCVFFQTFWPCELWFNFHRRDVRVCVSVCFLSLFNSQQHSSVCYGCLVLHCLLILVICCVSATTRTAHPYARQSFFSLFIYSHHRVSVYLFWLRIILLMGYIHSTWCVRCAYMLICKNVLTLSHAFKNS